MPYWITIADHEIGTQTPDSMAAPPHVRPQVSSYGPSHASSPGSAHSPHDTQTRHSYGQPAHQSMFYPSYSISSNSSYSSHGGSSHQQMPSQGSIGVPYPQGHSPFHTQQSMMDSSPRRAFSQSAISGPGPYMTTPQLGSSRPPGSSGGIHSGGSHQNANPGPIPATQPIVMKKNNVDEISFEYSRDRVKVNYTIRGDVETVDPNSLSHEFKENNCVYPRAYHSDEYKGNRLAYESDCNRLAWSLAALNPNIQGRRGLIQRAVDSWRNCHKDPKLRSRRVRRVQKQRHRQHNGKAASVGSSGPSTSGHTDFDPNASGMRGDDMHMPQHVHHHSLQNEPSIHSGVGDPNGKFDLCTAQDPPNFRSSFPVPC